MISVIVPSRGRPDELLLSLNSLRLVENGLEALVWLDNDDPKLDQYQRLLKSNDQIKVFVKDRVAYKKIHEMQHFLATQASFDWIFIWNDDATMTNPDWFAIFKNFVKDFEPATQPVVINIWGQGITIKNLFPIVSRAYFEILGHFGLTPTLDVWVRMVGVEANITYDLNGIKPKHRKDKVPDILIDETFEDVESDRLEFGGQWDPRHSHLRPLLEADIEKILRYKKVSFKL